VGEEMGKTGGDRQNSEKRRGQAFGGGDGQDSERRKGQTCGGDGQDRERRRGQTCGGGEGQTAEGGEVKLVEEGRGTDSRSSREGFLLNIYQNNGKTKLHSFKVFYIKTKQKAPFQNIYIKEEQTDKF